ncbi:MAG: hypothetical protein Q7J07_07800 [Pelolinea sp.]|nr:hypothetical protein [Pelolinea sp.]
MAGHTARRRRVYLGDFGMEMIIYSRSPLRLKDCLFRADARLRRYGSRFARIDPKRLISLLFGTCFTYSREIDSLGRAIASVLRPQRLDTRQRHFNIYELDSICSSVLCGQTHKKHGLDRKNQHALAPALRSPEHLSREWCEGPRPPVPSRHAVGVDTYLLSVRFAWLPRLFGLSVHSMNIKPKTHLRQMPRRLLGFGGLGSWLSRRNTKHQSPPGRPKLSPFPRQTSFNISNLEIFRADDPNTKPLPGTLRDSCKDGITRAVLPKLMSLKLACVILPYLSLFASRPTGSFGKPGNLFAKVSRFVFQLCNSGSGFYKGSYRKHDETKTSLSITKLYMKPFNNLNYLSFLSCSLISVLSGAGRSAAAFSRFDGAQPSNAAY